MSCLSNHLGNKLWLALSIKAQEKPSALKPTYRFARDIVCLKLKLYTYRRFVCI